MLPLLLLAVLCTLLTPSSTLPDGAPVSVCTTMLPFHGGGIAPMTTASPFKISIAQTKVSQGQTIIVAIESTPPELTFGGYMIHARARNGANQVVGRFAPSSVGGLVKLIDCDGTENTATHSIPTPKSNFELTWQAPNDFLGEVVFKYVLSHW